ncbi:MAG: HU family DNA-binding protein [Lachnospiraceae bacterium]|nr:HU family DNA-binding protein [Lachnospiraceae bacterium]
MNKSELVAAIAEKTDLTKTQSEKALKAFMETVEEALKNDDKISLVGFGTFSVSTRKEREGRNPSSGEKITIPEQKVPKFKAGKALKDAVNVPPKKKGKGKKKK